MMKHLLLTILICFGVLSSCQEPERIVEFYYNETQCSDPWTRGTDEETKEAVITYLDTQGIQAIQVVIESIPDQSPINCAACSCGSGRRYLVTVPAEHVSLIEALGFIRK